MKTNHRSIPLQSGQALAVDRHGSARLYVTEGEVLLRSPAKWLANTVVVAPPRRVAAPALLDCAEVESITAVGAAQIRIEEAANPLGQLKSAWDAARFAWSHTAH
jgi:hypothetical protein